jgi:two-component system, NtrC family, sensor kinase
LSNSVSENEKSRHRPDRLQNPYYRSLARKMTTLVLVVSVTPLLLVSGVILYEFQTSYKEKVYAHLGELVEKHRQNIETFLNEKLNDVRFLGKSLFDDQINDITVLQNRLEAFQQVFSPAFVDLGVVDTQGIQIAYVGPFKLDKAQYSDADWFKKASNSDYFISNVFLGLRGLPHFIIAVRENWAGNPTIIRATIDFVAFNNLVERIRIGATGFAFILNRNGELQTQTTPENLPQKGPYRDFLGIRQEEGTKVHIVEKMDASGQMNIYVAAFLKNGDWLLVYQQRAYDAFSDLRRTQNIAFVIIMIGGIGIVTMALLLSRRMISRMAQADRDKEMMDKQVIETGKLASIGELAAGIAHEINNPVAIMVEEAGWIEDLLEEEDLKEGKNLEEFQRALKQIRVQGYRCKDITHNLLSFARKTDGKVKKLQLNALIEEMVRLSAQRAKFGNVAIETDFKVDLPLIEASEIELQQVFLNLINNALDAMEKGGGKLKITTHLESEEKFHGVVVDIADSGPGIPKVNLSKIFDPFFTTKPVGKGTGLGLSICYGIINKMGGEISVDSILGEGTTFHLRFPLSRPPLAEALDTTQADNA